MLQTLKIFGRSTYWDLGASVQFVSQLFNFFTAFGDSYWFHVNSPHLKGGRTCPPPSCGAGSWTLALGPCCPHQHSGDWTPGVSRRSQPDLSVTCGWKCPWNAQRDTLESWDIFWDIFVKPFLQIIFRKVPVKNQDVSISMTDHHHSPSLTNTLQLVKELHKPLPGIHGGEKHPPLNFKDLPLPCRPLLHIQLNFPPPVHRTTA